MGVEDTVPYGYNPEDDTFVQPPGEENEVVVEEPQSIPGDDFDHWPRFVSHISGLPSRLSSSLTLPLPDIGG